MTRVIALSIGPRGRQLLGLFVGVLVLVSNTHPVAAQDHLWSHAFGDTGTDQGFSVATDGSGNVVVTGFFQGTVDFGGVPLTSAGDEDIFLAKYDANGNHLWSQRFGGTGIDRGRSVATDGSGNVVVTGRFAGTVNFGGDTLTSAGDDDIFLAKYDANGTHLWSRRFGDTRIDTGFSVTTDGSGNVVVTGVFEGTADFGGVPLTSAGGFDIFLAKYDANGNHLWSQRFGDTGLDFGRSVATDGSGNVVVTGHFRGTVDFGGVPLTGAGAVDIFLAKYDSGGTHVWSRRFGDTGFDFGRSVATDGSGNVVVTGHFRGTVDFGGVPLTSAGGEDIFLAKYDANGNHLWSQRFGDILNDSGLGVATDGSGNVAVTGFFSGTVDFGGGPLTSAGSFDIFLAKYDSGGTHLWSQRFGSPSVSLNTGIDRGRSVATDGSGNVVVTGDFEGTVNFGGGPLTSAGAQDVFLAKFGAAADECPGECVGPRITVSDAQGRTGDIVFVEVGVQESPADIDAFGFDLSYDTNMLRFVGCERGDLTMGWTGFDCFENTPGTITLGAFDPKPVGAGVTGSLARLAFEVMCGEGDVSELIPSELTDDIEGMEFCCGTFTCVICVSDGDVNNDGLITPGDAQCALEIFTHKQTVSADCDVPDWECEVIAADVKCDGVVTPSDALEIFNRFMAGEGPEECFALRPVVSAGTSGGGGTFYDVPMDRVVTEGANVMVVPVVMEASKGQAAFGFELTYDPEALRYEGISLSVAGRAWAALTAHEVTPGHVLVGGFDPRGLSAAAVAGGREGDGTVELAGLRFRKLSEEYTLEPVRWIEQILKRESGEDDPGERGDRVTQFSLGRPFPNPMRSAISTFVTVPTGERHRVNVSIYDVQGRLVKTLLNSEVGGGTHDVSWDRRNARGHLVSSGIYFLQMKVRERGFIDTRKVVVLR